MIWEVARPQGLRVAFQAPEEAEGSRTAVHVRSTWRRLSKRRHEGEEHQRITLVSDDPKIRAVAEAALCSGATRAQKGLLTQAEAFMLRPEAGQWVGRGGR